MNMTGSLVHWVVLFVALIAALVLGWFGYGYLVVRRKSRPAQGQTPITEDMVKQKLAQIDLDL